VWCTKLEVNIAKENATKLLYSLEEVEAEIVAVKEDAQSANMEISIVKDALPDKENELHLRNQMTIMCQLQKKSMICYTRKHKRLKNMQVKE